MAAVTDAGVGLAELSSARGESCLVEPVARRLESLKTGVSLPYAFYGAAWLDANRFVLSEDGGVGVVDLAALPHTTLPWPP